MRLQYLLALGVAASSVAVRAEEASRQTATERRRAAAAPIYRNGQVVSIDTAGRVLVIESRDGVQTSLAVDPKVPAVAELKEGDEVMITLRGNPARVLAIAKSEAPALSETVALPAPADSTTPDTAGGGVRPTPPVVEAAPGGAAALPPDVVPPQTATSVAQAREAFATRVAILAQQATAVERPWLEFTSSCSATVNGRYEGARPWFGLWDNQVKADLSTEACRELFNRVVGAGQGVLNGMVAAQDEARARGVNAGEMRTVLKGHAMDWEGWGRPAPSRLER